MEDKIKELQAVQITILEKVLEVLKEHNLSYIAVGGTVLGAYRHQGYIPWDDDIDIAMPRADYDKLLTLQNSLPEELFIQHFSTEKNYPLYYAKIRLNDTRFVERRFKNNDIHHGVFIDIFPLDNITETDNIIEKKHLLEKYSNNFRRSLKPYKRWLYRLLSPFSSAQSYFQQCDKLCTKDNDTKTEKIGFILTDDFFENQKNWSECQLPFEHLMINVPKNFENYLENKYGNYMEIPNIKDRKTHNIVELSI